jgi:hypothetical protein
MMAGRRLLDESGPMRVEEPRLRDEAESMRVEECRLLDKAGPMQVEERRLRDEARAAVEDLLPFAFSPLLLAELVE